MIAFLSINSHYVRTHSDVESKDLGPLQQLHFYKFQVLQFAENNAHNLHTFLRQN